MQCINIKFLLVIMWTPPKKLRLFFPFLFLLCSNHHSFRLRLSPLHRATGPHRPYPIHRSQRSRSWRRRCPTAETPLLEIYLEGFPKQPFSPNTPPPPPAGCWIVSSLFSVWRLIFFMFSFRNPELEALYLAILVAGGEGQIQRIATRIQRKDPKNKNEILGSSSILNEKKYNDFHGKSFCGYWMIGCVLSRYAHR